MPIIEALMLLDADIVREGDKVLLRDDDTELVAACEDEPEVDTVAVLAALCVRGAAAADEGLD